jgi:hypothetical protein
MASESGRFKAWHLVRTFSPIGGVAIQETSRLGDFSTAYEAQRAVKDMLAMRGEARISNTGDMDAVRAERRVIR